MTFTCPELIISQGREYSGDTDSEDGIFLQDLGKDEEDSEDEENEDVEMKDVTNESEEGSDDEGSDQDGDDEDSDVEEENGHRMDQFADEPRTEAEEKEYEGVVNPGCILAQEYDWEDSSSDFTDEEDSEGQDLDGVEMSDGSSNDETDEETDDEILDIHSD